MKKMICILVCLLALCTTVVWAGNEKPIQLDQLPATAQQFIKQYFADHKVLLAKVETGFMSKEYEVIFSDGDHIDFDSKGNWKEIDCKSSFVPVSVIPTAIMEYVRTNYPVETVKKIEKDRREYEVELSNRVELSFDLNFNVIDINV